MARTLKGTRARGLPPKLLLSRKQDATGSFPTVWRTASDNRTGKYPVFFNDNKVVSFNQPVTNPGIFVTTYPEYEEKVVVVGSPGNPINESDPIVFDNSFSGTPIVVITEITSNPNTPMVIAFVSVMSTTGSIIGFSAPFEGTFVYRAIYQPAYGNPVNVLRSPRYTDQYSLVVAENNIMSSNTSYVTFSDFGSTPTENYVTFWDYNGPPNNTGANLSGSVNSTYITNTSVQVTASAQGGGSTVLHYMGVGPSTASIDVTGIVYPLVMTPQAINAGLSQADKTDLYKQPYFSGSSIVNQPIVASGSMVKGVSDLFVTFTPGQDVEPFMDFANPEVDGKVSASIGGVNPFYATGSAVTTTGLGFQQPLWSKNKIEIDLDVSTPVTFGQSTYDNQDKLMAYYDFVQKTYVPIGDSRGNHQLLTASNSSRIFGFGINNTEYYASKSIGFGPSTFGYFGNSTFVGDLEKNAGKLFATPVNSFGFPYDTKRYGITTNNTMGAINTNKNMLMDIGKYISEPFLLEKLVLEFTGAMSSSGTDDSGFSAMSTFFILNQTNTTFAKPEKTYTALQGIVVPNPSPPPVVLPFLDIGFENSITNGTTGLDLVTYCQIAALTSSLLNQSASLNNSYTRDLNIYQEATTPVPFSYGLNADFGYSGSFIVSASIRAPTALEYSNLFRSWYVYSAFPTIGCVNLSWLDNRYGGRKSLPEPCGRNWKNLLASQNPADLIDIGAPLNTTILTQDRTFEENPYLLLPTDKLIFGWQCPFANVSGSILGNVGDLPQLHFPAGKGKLILYGSTLRINPETNQLEEHHDTLNQLLCSNSVHEIIG